MKCNGIRGNFGNRHCPGFRFASSGLHVYAEIDAGALNLVVNGKGIMELILSSVGAGVAGFIIRGGVFSVTRQEAFN